MRIDLRVTDPGVQVDELRGYLHEALAEVPVVAAVAWDPTGAPLRAPAGARTAYLEIEISGPESAVTLAVGLTKLWLRNRVADTEVTTVTVTPYVEGIPA